MRWLSRLLRYVPAEEREGIALRPPAWEASCPRQQDLASFLRALDDLVPPGSVLYLEGGDPTPEIRSYLEERTADQTTRVALGTIWPRPQCFHMRATRDNLDGLAELAERHATPEIAVHLHVYKGDTVLLEWPDAFADPFRVSKEIPEDKVREFCARLGIKYEECAEDT